MVSADLFSSHILSQLKHAPTFFREGVSPDAYSTPLFCHYTEVPKKEWKRIKQPTYKQCGPEKG